MIVNVGKLKYRFATSLIAIFCLLISAGICAQETFAEWERNNQAAIEQSVLPITERALKEGFDVVYIELRADVEELKTATGLTTDEIRWIDNFLAAMAASVLPADTTTANEALDELGSLARGAGGRTVNGAELLQSACQKVRSAVQRNPFDPDDDPITGDFIILEPRNDSAGEIRFDRDEGSTVARELWRIAFLWGGAIAKSNAQCMTVTARAITDASERWDNFMTNVAGDQFMWETLINGWLGERFDSLAGTLAYPPEWQLRIVHPEPVMVVSMEGSTEFKPRIAVEALGYRKLTPSSGYMARNGISLVLTLPASNDEETGYGLLYTRKAATFGVISQKISGQGNVISLVFGITLADRLENTSKKLKQRRQLIEDQLEAVRDAIDDCRDDLGDCVLGL